MGPMTPTSSSGNKHAMVVHAFDPNAMSAEPMKNRLAETIVATFEKILNRLVKAGFKPKLQRPNNEASAVLQEFLHDDEIDFQLTPACMHRRNAAECAMQTF